MSKTTILYKDIAPGAEEDAAVSTGSASWFSDPSLLPGGIAPAPSITCEPNHWGLNGTFVTYNSQSVAFWSAEQSGDDCIFTNPPVITVEFDEQYSSLGIALAFDRQTGDYCSSVNIKWYQGDTLKAEGDFFPDSATYFCEQKVTSYSKVVISLNSTNLPKRYGKLEQILFGIYRYFGMSELRSASIVNESNLIAMELPISTLKWTLDSRENIDFMFQLKQPVEVQNNGKLIGVYYIDGYSRSAASVYNIECYDAFGVLDENPFSGGVYTDKSAKELLAEILNGDFEVEYAESVVDVSLNGAIQPTTKREAVQQVLFAWGVCAATDGGEKIRVFHLQDETIEVGQNRTYTGVSVDVSSIVTEVRVTAHSYAQASDGNIEIGGVKYNDTETVYTVSNPDVTASDKQNVVEITGATLVSAAIGQAVAQRVYDYYLKRSTNKAKIVWNSEMLGDYLTLPNAWGGTNTGHLAKMEIALSNTVAVSCETVGV